MTRDNPLAITEERDVPYRPGVESPVVVAADFGTATSEHAGG